MKTLTTEQLAERGEAMDDFVLINVLPPKYFKEKHIPHSINVPLEDDKFTELVEKVAGRKDRKVVVYCANFGCDVSEKAAKELEQADFSNIFDYEGGTEEWFEKQSNQKVA